MPGGTYLLRDGQLVDMRSAAFPSEDDLQLLLADHPGLLSEIASAADGSDGPNWLLVDREVGVPDQPNGGDRWSLDHLFLDREAVPTLVEVKRGSNTQVRREVVGQMLDYAANAIRHWPIAVVRRRFEERATRDGRDPQAMLAALLGPEADPDQFWQQVETNLLAGKVRMVFVADVIPPELRAIVEFMNAQMDPAEVLALEIRRFVGGGAETLVPAVIGRTSRAEQRKGPAAARERRSWDRDTFLAVAKEGGMPALSVEILDRILAWAIDGDARSRLAFRWGIGRDIGSFHVSDPTSGRAMASFDTLGGFSIRWRQLAAIPAFASPDARIALLHRFNGALGKVQPDSIIDSEFRGYSLKEADRDVSADVIAILEDMLEQATIAR